jgi:hypothetical protein
MLSLLNAHGGHSANGIQRVRQKVHFAHDLETLWYLRQDILSALTAIDGEDAALDQMKPINGLFKGELPDTMGPRVHQRFQA